MEIKFVDAAGLIRLRCDTKGEVFALEGPARKRVGRVDVASGEAFSAEGELIGYARAGRAKVRRVHTAAPGKTGAPRRRAAPRQPEAPRRSAARFKVTPSGKVLRTVGPFGLIRRPAGYTLVWSDASGPAYSTPGRGTPCLKMHDAIHAAEAPERVPREALALAAALLFLPGL